jgi:hypothetical protein
VSEASIGCVGVTMGHHGKSFDAFNPLIDLNVNPVGFFTSRSDKTTEVAVSSRTAKVEFIEVIEGGRRNVSRCNQD